MAEQDCARMEEECKKNVMTELISNKPLSKPIKDHYLFFGSIPLPSTLYQILGNGDHIFNCISLANMVIKTKSSSSSSPSAILTSKICN